MPFLVLLSFCVWSHSGPGYCDDSFFLATKRKCGTLIPWSGIKPTPLAVEALSLNCWTSKEVPSDGSKGVNGNFFGETRKPHLPNCRATLVTMARWAALVFEEWVFSVWRRGQCLPRHGAASLMSRTWVDRRSWRWAWMLVVQGLLLSHHPRG